MRDANLKTTEPIFTEKFTIFNSEGAASCDGGSGDRVTEIQTELTSYFEQLYPEEMIAAEKAAEELAEAERVDRENAAREAEERTQKAAEEGLPLFDPLQEGIGQFQRYRHRHGFSAVGRTLGNRGRPIYGGERYSNSCGTNGQW